MLILCWEYSFELNFKKMAGNLKKTVVSFRFPAVFLKKKKAKSEGIEGGIYNICVCFKRKYR